MTDLNEAAAKAMQDEWDSQYPVSDEFKSREQLQIERAESDGLDGGRRAFEGTAPRRHDGIDVTFGGLCDPDSGPPAAGLVVTGFAKPYTLWIEFPSAGPQDAPRFSTDLQPGTPAGEMVVGHLLHQVDAEEAAELLDLREPGSPSLDAYVSAARHSADAGRAAYAASFETCIETKPAGEVTPSVDRGVAERMHAAFPHRATQPAVGNAGVQAAPDPWATSRGTGVEGAVHER